MNKSIFTLFLSLLLLVGACSKGEKNSEGATGFVSANFTVESENLTYLGNFRHDRVTRYSSVWGYTDPNGREYALLGVYDGLSIVDITDAPDLEEVAFIPGPGSKWREMKVYKHYAYVVNEEGGGMHIIDLSHLPQTASKVSTFAGFETSHNISIDEEKELLFAEGDDSEPVRVYSLQDPLNPTLITTIGLHDNHDMYAYNNRVYLAEGHARTVAIYDSTDVNDIKLLKRFSIPNGGFVHNAWSTEDGNFLLTTEENRGKTVKIWDIRDLENIKVVGEYLGPNLYAHNVHVKGNTAYLAHYRSGLRIVDISDPTNPLEKAYLQKNISSSGAWGAYPYFNSGKVIISDIEEGLFVARYLP